MRRRALFAVGLLASCGGSSVHENAPTELQTTRATAQATAPTAPRAAGRDLTAVQLMSMWEGCQVGAARNHPEWSGAFGGKACSCVVDRARDRAVRGEDPKVPPTDAEIERCRAHARETETAREMVPSPFAKKLLHPTEALVGGYLSCFASAAGSERPEPAQAKLAHGYCFCLVEAMHTSTASVEATVDAADERCRVESRASAP